MKSHTHTHTVFDIGVTSPCSSCSSPSFRCRCILFYSSATQINSRLPRPIHLSHKSARFVVAPALAMRNLCCTPRWVKNSDTGAVITTAFFSLSASDSFFSYLKGCGGRRSFYLFSPSEMACLDLKEEAHDWHS